MQQFLLRRVGMALLTLFALSILTFLLVRPDPYVLDTPTDRLVNLERPHQITQFGESVVQYSEYVKNVLLGNWGESWKWGEPKKIFLERLPMTLQLTAPAIALGTIWGVSIGVLAAINRGSPFDRLSNAIFRIGQSIPIFWLGLILLWSYAFISGSLPNRDEGEIIPIILPIITLALLPLAVFKRLTRSAVLSALDSDYVKLARIRGLSEWTIIWKHCLRNVAVSPILTFSLVGGFFLSGLVLTEVVFTWQGAGLLVFESIYFRDRFALHGAVLLLGTAFILCHLAADLLRAFLDPRIRYSARTHIQYDV